MAVSSSVMLTFAFVAALVSVTFAQQPFPAAFPVANYDRCPGTCVTGVRYCIKTGGCAKCDDCVRCGTFAAPICPVKGIKFPLLERGLGKCLGNLDLTTLKGVDSFGRSRGICGCTPPAVQMNATHCTGGKPPNPIKIPVMRSPPLPSPPAPSFNNPKKFLVQQFSTCPSLCTKRSELVCVNKVVCNFCRDCQLCGSFGGFPCKAGVLPGDKKCRNNLIELEVTASFPKLPTGSKSWPANTKVCGCPQGLVQDLSIGGAANRCLTLPSPPLSPKPPVYSPPSPKP